jgi:tetratricopeptide (TPR) repeat protein
MLDRVSKCFLTIAVAWVMISLPAQSQSQPAQGGLPAKNWKDRAEYDLYNAIVKEQGSNERLALLNSWKEKYPVSDYAPERLQIYVTSYSALNQPDKVIVAGDQVLQTDPKNLTALYLMALNVQRLPKPSPDELASGEKAVNGLISNLDAFFAADKKPAGTRDADWATAKKEAEVLAHTSLGWISLQKKDNDAAEREVVKVLQWKPNNAQVSYWLGTAIAAGKKPERYSEALWQFARAGSLDEAQGGLNPQARQQIDTYFINAYNRYHGQDPQGLAQLRELAKAKPFPPAGFKIDSVEALKAKNEEEFRKKNPALAMWMNLKQELTGSNGEQYFNDNLKGAEVPGGAEGIQSFKGKLISAKPAVRPKELVLAMMDSNTPEVTLHLDAPLPGQAEPGVEIEFDGVPTAFTKDAFNVTFDVEKKKIVGWPGKEAATVGRNAPVRKQD